MDRQTKQVGLTEAGRRTGAEDNRQRQTGTARQMDRPTRQVGLTEAGRRTGAEDDRQTNRHS